MSDPLDFNQYARAAHHMNVAMTPHSSPAGWCREGESEGLQMFSVVKSIPLLWTPLPLMILILYDLFRKYIVNETSTRLHWAMPSNCCLGGTAERVLTFSSAVLGSNPTVTLQAGLEHTAAELTTESSSRCATDTPHYEFVKLSPVVLLSCYRTVQIQIILFS